MFSVIILSLVITYLSSVMDDIDLSGNLAPQRTVNKNDMVTYTFRGKSKAILAPDQHIFTITGGNVDIEGKDNTIDITQDYCVDGVTCTDPNIYFMDITGSSTMMSIDNCVFNVLDKFCAVIQASNTQHLDISDCEITGSLFMFGKFTDSELISIDDCIFRNLKSEVDSVFLSYGFILTIVNCDLFSVDGCEFRNVVSAEYNADEGAVAGYIAPVFVQGGKNFDIYGSDFDSCTGLLSGGVVSYQPGKKTRYRRDHFTRNSYLLPTSDLPDILNTLPGGSELVGALKDYLVLGNDITRIGGSEPKTMDLLCSTSEEPHFRNDLSIVNFGTKCALFTTWEIMQFVLGSVAVVVTTLGIVLCCCCGCCCACCYSCPCCSRCCYRTQCRQCRQVNTNDYESPSGNATAVAPPQPGPQVQPQLQGQGCPPGEYPAKDLAQQQGYSAEGAMQQNPIQGGEGYLHLPGQGYLPGQEYPGGYYQQPGLGSVQAPQMQPYPPMQYPPQGQYYPPPQNQALQPSYPDKEVVGW